MEDRRLLATTDPIASSNLFEARDAAEGESSHATVGPSLALDATASPRQNPINRYDVDRDGIVAPQDVLSVINSLTRYGSIFEIQNLDATVREYLDVNNDLWISPIDVLQVINFLSSTARLQPIAGLGPITYAVGNSLTVDLMFDLRNLGFDKLTRGTSVPTLSDWHVNCGSSLTTIWENPETTCLSPLYLGKYREALIKPVDNVFLQTHYGFTVAHEIQAIKNFIDYTRQNPANSDTRFFLHAAWGEQVSGHTGLPFFDTWITHQATLDGDFVPSKSTFGLITSELKRAGYEIALIPSGHSIAAIVGAIRNGVQIEMIAKPGNEPPRFSLTESEVYRDSIHASSTGKFIAGLSAYSSVYGIEPNGLNPLDYTDFQTYGAESVLSPAGARTVEQIVWNTYLAERVSNR